MRTIFYSLLGAICFLFLSCDDDLLEPVIFSYKGPFGLTSEKTSLCPGMETQLNLWSFYSSEYGENIPISKLIFDPIPAESGILYSHGLFKAPEVVSKTQIVTIKAKFKSDPDVIVSLDLELVSPDKSNTSYVEAINLLDPVWGQPGLSDMNAEGDFLIGPMDYGYEIIENYSLEATVYDSLGKKKWHYNGNGANTNFIKFLDDRVLLSGTPITRESNNIYKTILLDENGKEVPGFKFPETLVPAVLHKNGKGDFFINSKDESKPDISIIQKVNSNFEIEWQKNINYPVNDFLVTNEEEILIYSEKGLGWPVRLVYFDKNGNELWEMNFENKDLNAAHLNSAHLIELPNGNFGLIKSERSSTNSEIEWVYYGVNRSGQIIQNREVIFSGLIRDYSGYAPVESNKKYVLGISKVLVSKSGELLLLGTAYTNDNQYLIIKGINKSSLEIKVAPNSNVLQFVQNHSGIRITTLDYDAVKYQIGPNLEFNSCLAGL